MTDLPELTHVIAGRPDDDAGPTLPVFDPSTGTTVADIPNASAETVDAAVAAATAALAAWSELTPSQRAGRMMDLADCLEENLDRIVELETLDCGKPLQNAREESKFAIDLIRFCAGAGRCMEGKAAQEYAAGKTSFVRREPLGVVAGITPWNYPVVMLAYKLAPALAAGNTLVVKPAEQTPLSTAFIAARAQETLPAGVVNLVLGDGPTTGTAMVRHPDVALVTLTGETETGKLVAREAAATLKRVVLELGGKSPVVVFDDADMDLTARGVSHGAFYNSGQDCTAASRVLAAAGVYDEVVDRLSASASGIRLGGPADAADMGPLVSSEQQDRVSGFIERAGDRGSTVRSSSEVPGSGYFIAPTVISDVGANDEIVQSEVFGPVVSVQRFNTDAEAVELANSTRYGLGASVWTRNVGRAMDVSRRLAVGAVWVNCHDVVTPEMPHGGVRASGYGKDLSMYSIEDMTHVKHVMVSHER